MRCHVHAIAVFVVLLDAVGRGHCNPPAAGVVHELNAANFSEVLAADADRAWLVEFWAPWCTHCQKLAPVFLKAAASPKLDGNARLAAVDGTSAEGLIERFGISSYPTLLIFKGPSCEPYRYEGERTEKGIVNDMNEKAEPSWKPPPNRVVELTASSFRDFVKKEPLTMVEFYQPDCSPCKNLEPEYKLAAKRLWELQSGRVRIARVNFAGGAAQRLAREFDVTGAPTLIVFEDGTPTVYSGKRNANAIYGELLDRKRPAAQELTTYYEASLLAEDNAYVVIGFFDEGADGSAEQLAAFMAAARIAQKDFTTFYVAKAEVRKKFAGIQTGMVAAFADKRFRSKYEDKFALRTTHGTPEDIVEWIKTSSLPLVGMLVKKPFPAGVGKYATITPRLVAYFDAEYSKAAYATTNMVRAKIVDVAKDYQGQLTFAIASEIEYDKELQTEFGLGNSDLEVKAVITDSEGVSFTMPEDMEIREFVEAFFEGELTAHVKSEPVPKKKTKTKKGTVTKVVGTTFAPIVENSAKNVLVMLHVPWCPICTAFMPNYKKLAKGLKGVKGLELAMMDADLNQIPKPYVHTAARKMKVSLANKAEKVSGHPTIWLSPKGENAAPIPYMGADFPPDINDVADFLARHIPAVAKVQSKPVKMWKPTSGAGDEAQKLELAAQLGLPADTFTKVAKKEKKGKEEL